MEYYCLQVAKCSEKGSQPMLGPVGSGPRAEQVETHSCGLTSPGRVTDSPRPLLAVQVRVSLPEKYLPTFKSLFKG